MLNFDKRITNRQTEIDWTIKQLADQQADKFEK
jgi:hypothetical protein